jgi:hypothetical protein
MGKRISLVIILLSMVFVFAVYGEKIEYKEYKVLQGDTLWDIASKEIQNPFLWPKIWKENPEIKNPDRISPGQIIRIPLRVVEEEPPAPPVEKVVEPVVPEQKEEPKIVVRDIKPIERRYIADSNLILSSGYITDYITPEIKSIGEITGSPTGRNIFGKEDYVYIKTKFPWTQGDKFYIIRSTAFIEHPKTKNKLGHLIEVVGALEIIGWDNGETKAKVTKSYVDIRRGDLLDSYFEVEPLMEESSYRRPDISGIIVAARQMRMISGTMDILFIDKGSNNGIAAGDIVKTISTDKRSGAKWSGVIQIINVRGATSTAVVKQSENAISVGDDVVSLK